MKTITKKRKEIREVYITTEQGAHLVRYLERRKHQRYFAAQFSESMRTRAEVEQWVEEQSDLQLVRLPDRRLARINAERPPLNIGQVVTLAHHTSTITRKGVKVMIRAIRRDKCYAGGFKVQVMLPNRTKPSWLSIHWFEEFINAEAKKK